MSDHADLVERLRDPLSRPSSPWISRRAHDADCNAAADLIEQQARAIAARDEEIKRLREDAARLDWLEEHAFHMDAGRSEFIYVLRKPLIASYQHGDSLRSGIDIAALAQEPKV